MMDWRFLMSGATARQVSAELPAESYDQYDHNDQNQASSGSFGHQQTDRSEEGAHSAGAPLNLELKIVWK